MNTYIRVRPFYLSDPLEAKRIVTAGSFVLWKKREAGIETKQMTFIKSKGKGDKRQQRPIILGG